MCIFESAVQGPSYDDAIISFQSALLAQKLQKEIKSMEQLLLYQGNKVWACYKTCIIIEKKRYEDNYDRSSDSGPSKCDGRFAAGVNQPVIPDEAASLMLSPLAIRPDGRPMANLS